MILRILRDGLVNKGLSGYYKIVGEHGQMVVWRMIEAQAPSCRQIEI